jgi:formylglycine-generating enzyme required for sulfatase activity
VTCEQYFDFVQATRHPAPAAWRESAAGGPHPDEAEHPVVGVSFHDAESYCRWAKARLPRAAEFERAQRGAGGRYYPFGNSFDEFACNTLELQVGRTTSVFRFATGRSPEGVWDVCGNVSEWCVDEQPGGRGGRVVLGGSFDESCELYGLSFWIQYANPGQALPNVGFRMSRD